jgi:hypothetical protein
MRMGEQVATSYGPAFNKSKGKSPHMKCSVSRVFELKTRKNGEAARKKGVGRLGVHL